MRRRDFTTLLSAAAATWPLGAWAQHAGKMWRIAFISQAQQNIYEVLFERLRELGYVEGQNIIIERRYAEGRQRDSRNLQPRWFDSRLT
jgi:putative tryptophan/tyrosine transport system substrate-binding protein